MTSSIERSTPNSAFLRAQSRERARHLLHASGLFMTGACLALSAAAIAGAPMQKAAVVIGVAGGAALFTAAREQSLRAMLDLRSRFAAAVQQVRQMPQARRDAVLAGMAGAVSLAIAIHMMQAPAPVLMSVTAPIQLPDTMLTDLVRSTQGSLVAKGDFVVAGISLAGMDAADAVEVIRMLEREGYGVREGQGGAWVAASREQLVRLESAARDLDVPVTQVVAGEVFFQSPDHSDQLKRDIARWVGRMTQGHHLAPAWLADSMQQWAVPRDAGAPRP